MTEDLSSAGRGKRCWDGVMLFLTGLTGVVAFLYPFLFPPAVQRPGGAQAHAQDAPLFLGVLLLLMLTFLLANLTGEGMGSKDVAMLGVLAAAGAVLRFLPLPGGASAFFFLPILAGYVYGPTFGFLAGSSALLVAALFSGGIGPWLPYQMFAAGWVGALPGFLPRRGRDDRLELVLLAFTGFLLGLFYGAVMNLWFWPFVYQPQLPGQYWQAGLGVTDTLRRYLLFYLTTSLWWDILRGAGNALLLLFFGVPVLRLFRRYQRRFYFRVRRELE